MIYGDVADPDGPWVKADEAEARIKELTDALWRCHELSGADLSHYDGPYGVWKPTDAVESVAELRRDYGEAGKEVAELESRLQAADELAGAYRIWKQPGPPPDEVWALMEAAHDRFMALAPGQQSEGLK
jgi:hypothetical protein